MIAFFSLSLLLLLLLPEQQVVLAATCHAAIPPTPSDYRSFPTTASTWASLSQFPNNNNNNNIVNNNIVNNNNYNNYNNNNNNNNNIIVNNNNTFTVVDRSANGPLTMDRVHILLASPLDNPVDCLAAVQLLLGDRVVGNAPNVAAEAIAGPGAEGGDSEFRYAVVRSGLSGLLPLDVLLDVQAGGDNPTVGDHCRAVRIDLILNTSPSSSSASSSCRAEDIRFALVVAAPPDWVECNIGESCRGTLPSVERVELPPVADGEGKLVVDVEAALAFTFHGSNEYVDYDYDLVASSETDGVFISSSDDELMHTSIWNGVLRNVQAAVFVSSRSGGTVGVVLDDGSNAAAQMPAAAPIAIVMAVLLLVL